MKDAARTIHSLFAAGFLPCALEVADAFTLAAARERTRSKRLGGCRAHLIVELDGQVFSVRNEIRSLQKIVRRHHPLFIETGFGVRQCEEIWKLRREFSTALRDTGLTKLNEDIVVPRGHLEDLFAFTARLQKKHRLPIACFGHAGDGNIHVNVMVDSTQPAAVSRSHAALDDLFRQILAWNGVITGEHGIGLAKKPWWPLATSPESRALHQTIKQALDPHGILNPGKFLFAK
jgi:glycolate oxidase